MRNKAKLLLFAASICAAPFFSCQKDNTNLRSSLAAGQNVDNAVADSVTDSSLNRGLVAWYTFNGDVLDHSGNHNDVIFNSAYITVGKSGLPKTAYRFDGTNSYMQVANSKSINPLKISLYALFKPGGFYQGVCHSNRMICKGFNDHANGRYLLGYDDQPYYDYLGCNQVVQSKYETFYCGYGDGGNASGTIDTTQYVKNGQWYSMVYTFDGVYSKLYINGVLVSKVNRYTTFTPNTNSLFIGKNEDPQYPYFFKGIIDEVRIYKRVLNQSEVTALYNKK